MCKFEAESDLVFILGIMQRSGTNYLNNLLLLHPNCEYPGFVWEDYLIAPAEYLNKYAELVYNNWNPAWKSRLTEIMGPNPLLRCLGEGLRSFFSKQFASNLRPRLGSTQVGEAFGDDSKKLVTATPSVRNIKYFFDLFPGAYLLIIIRDGRSVVESGIKSFDWDYEYAIRRWADAAETILQFVQTAQQKQYLIIKYEDLYTNTEKEMTKILSFLGLDIERYDFNAAANLTVTGSSELRNKEGKVHWNARKKTSDFNSIKRWHSWKRPLHERFNWLTESFMEQFKYTKKQYKSYQTLWNVWNIIMDRLFTMEVWLSQRNLFLYNLSKRLRKMFYSLTENICRKSEK